MLGIEGWLAAGILLGATALFLTRVVPLGVTALSLPVLLHAFGLLSPQEALSGFASPIPLAIGGVLVLGAALRESGVAGLIARGLMRLAGRSEGTLVLATCLVTAALSAFMNNSAVVAMLLPVALLVCRRAEIAPPRLLMPVAFAAVFGGTITLVGTAPNLIVDGFLRQLQGGSAGGFGVFDFAPVGGPVALLGVLVLAIFGRRLLSPDGRERAKRIRPLPEDVARRARLDESLFMFRVTAASKVCGRSLEEIDLQRRFGLALLMVRRQGAVGERWIHPVPNTRLEAGDRIYVQGNDESAWAFSESDLLQFGLAGPRSVDRILGRGSTLAEVAVPPHSTAAGKTLVDLLFRRRFGLDVLNILGADGEEVPALREHTLRIGDMLLVAGPADRVRELGEDPDWTLLTDQSQVENVSRAPLALALLLVALLPPMLTPMPLALSALGAAIIAVLTGCLSVDGLRRAVEWQTLALVAGTIPLGMALEKHGVVMRIAEGVMAVSTPLGPVGLLAVLFLLSSFLALVTTNAAAAVIAAPVAAQAAATGRLDLSAALLAVAYGCSCTFLLPHSQCNLMVAVPGGYRGRDFLRLGGWTSLLMLILTVALLAWRL